MFKPAQNKSMTYQFDADAFGHRFFSSSSMYTLIDKHFYIFKKYVIDLCDGRTLEVPTSYINPVFIINHV